jgi:hypothetical protein
MNSGFQTVVNQQPAPGVLGDFASTNPYSSVLTAAGGLTAPVGGLTVGNFFWVGPAGQTSQSYVAGWQIAFLGRNEQALITQFLGQSTLVVPAGFMVVGFTGGDFWAYFANGATALATVYADETTGAPEMSATNTVTGEIGFTGTASFATVGGVGQMTLATITSGIVTLGDLIVATGVTTGTSVVALVSGTANTVGAVYSMSATPTTEAAEATTTQSNVLNVTAVLTGGLSVGDGISGTGVTAGTTIAAFLTGVGGIGTYLLAIPGGAPVNTAAETITGPANISSGWTVGPITLAGAGIAKISHSPI